eukprot:g11513.t1
MVSDLEGNSEVVVFHISHVFGGACNTISSLVRSTLRTSPTTPGTFPCNRRKCYTRPCTSLLTSIRGTKQTFHIRQRFTCTSVNVVY